MPRILFIVLLISAATPIFGLSQDTDWLLEIGYPLGFRNELLPEQINQKPVETFDRNIFLGFSTLRPDRYDSKFRIGGSLLYFIAPLDEFNIKPVTSEIEPKINLTISGPAIQFRFWQSGLGPQIMISGGPALLEMEGDGSLTKRSEQQNYGAGISLATGYSFRFRDSQAFLVNFRLTYAGAFVVSEDAWCSFTIITFSFGFRV